MKKSNFTALVLGTVSGILFSLGMCMALLPMWNAFWPGIVCGGIGILLGIITIFVWRKMEHRPAIKLSGKILGRVAVGIIGALLLGVGMAFVMAWKNIPVGIVIGLIGIVILLFLIPMIKGFKS